MTGRLPSEWAFKEYKSSTTPKVGISLSGAVIALGLSGIGYDAFYPNMTYWSTPSATFHVGEFDHCLSHCDSNGFLHNHLFPVCQKYGAADYDTAPGEIHDDDDTRTIIEYGLSRFQKSLGRTPVGIAADGHVIYGPYKNDQTTYSACEVDACNGMYVNGFYSYAITTFLPYTIGCFGGANIPKGVAPQCTTNGRMCPN